MMSRRHSTSPPGTSLSCVGASPRLTSLSVISFRGPPSATSLSHRPLPGRPADMPPRTKSAPDAPSTMKELKDTLWKAADKLRGSLAAGQYKDVILGLVFLKYVSDAYDERREAIRADLLAQG